MRNGGHRANVLYCFGLGILSTGGHLTEFNSKVKIEYVDPLFVGPDFLTDVWVTEQAMKQLGKFKKSGTPYKQYLLKLKHYATNGFWNFEGNEGEPIRAEGSSVYRVAHVSSLFRLIGFYEDDTRTVFISIDAFKKGGRKLTSAQRDRINTVARVKKERRWKKRGV